MNKNLSSYISQSNHGRLSCLHNIQVRKVDFNNFESQQFLFFFLVFGVYNDFMGSMIVSGGLWCGL